MRKTSSRLLREQGIAMFIVLISLVVLALAALTMLRSVDTSLLLSGNFAFRKAATEAGDLGIEAAAAALPGLLSTSQEAVVLGQYYPSRTPTAGGLSWDTNGLPPASIWNIAQAVTGAPPGFTVAYVIERLCTGVLPITNMLLACVADVAPDTSSNKAGSVKFTASSAIYYRVTVRVTGPHNTISYVQAILSN
jgi:Tfp pilus assembly protein PilX